jgi:uncharacterized membrane protein YkvA (DUF1232 family)
MKGWIANIKEWARQLKRESLALWFACKDAETPVGAKAGALFTVAYALSPIDLIPDFIPVLGFLDDALLLPALIWVALRLIPAEVMERSRARADEWIGSGAGKPRSYVGAAAIGFVWIAAAFGAYAFIVR